MAYLLMFVVGIIGTSIFITNIELSLLALANLKYVPEFKIFSHTIDLSGYQVRYIFLLVLAATAGSTIGSGFYYLIGKASLRLSEKYRKRIERINLSRLEKYGSMLTFTAAAFSIPPFTPLSLAAGFIKFPVRNYIVFSFLGKCLRYFIVIYAAESIKTFLFHLPI